MSEDSKKSGQQSQATHTSLRGLLSTFCCVHHSQPRTREQSPALSEDNLDPQELSQITPRPPELQLPEFRMNELRDSMHQYRGLLDDQGARISAVKDILQAVRHLETPQGAQPRHLPRIPEECRGSPTEHFPPFKLLEQSSPASSQDSRHSHGSTFTNPPLEPVKPSQNAQNFQKTLESQKGTLESRTNSSKSVRSIALNDGAKTPEGPRETLRRLAKSSPAAILEAIVACDETMVTISSHAEELVFKKKRMDEILKIKHIRIVHPDPDIQVESTSEWEIGRQPLQFNGQPISMSNNLETITVDFTKTRRPPIGSRIDPAGANVAISLLRASRNPKKVIFRFMRIAYLPVLEHTPSVFYSWNHGVGFPGVQTSEVEGGKHFMVWTWEKPNNKNLRWKYGDFQSARGRRDQTE